MGTLEVYAPFRLDCVLVFVNTGLDVAPRRQSLRRAPTTAEYSPFFEVHTTSLVLKAGTIMDFDFEKSNYHTVRYTGELTGFDSSTQGIAPLNERSQGPPPTSFNVHVYLVRPLQYS